MQWLHHQTRYITIIPLFYIIKLVRFSNLMYFREKNKHYAIASLSVCLDIKPIASHWNTNILCTELYPQLLYETLLFFKLWWLLCLLCCALINQTYIGSSNFYSSSSLRSSSQWMRETSLCRLRSISQWQSWYMGNNCYSVFIIWWDLFQSTFRLTKYV